MTSTPGCERFPEAELTDDAFLGRRLQVLQPRAGYRAAMDPVLLAAAVPARAGQAVLELGCGAGVASLCLGRRVAGLDLWGLERQPAYADLARRNAARNGLAVQVLTGDLAALPGPLRRGFDHVMANPPYYAPAAGTPARDGGREAALREETPLADWLAVAARRLHPGGWLTVIQAADRLRDLLAGLPGTMGSVTVLPLAPRAGRAAGRVILHARKGGRAPLRLLAPLILHEGPAHDGDRENHSAVLRGILRDGGALPIPPQG